MKYNRKITDLDTGEIISISLGEHRTITETADHLKVSRKSLTEVLLKMEICRREYDEVAGKTRIRLHPDAVESGLGYRIMGPHGPFDVTTPLCLEVIKDELKKHLKSKCPTKWHPVFNALHDFETWRAKEKMSELTPQMKVCWIVDQFGDVPPETIAKGIGVANSLVYRYLSYRKKQLAGEMHPLKRKLKRETGVPFGCDFAEAA